MELSRALSDCMEMTAPIGRVREADLMDLDLRVLKTWAFFVLGMVEAVSSNICGRLETLWSGIKVDVWISVVELRACC
jgi:hypothetical protein